MSNPSFLSDRRTRRLILLLAFTLVVLAIPLTARATGPLCPCSFQYWNGSAKEDTWKSQAAFGTINGGFAAGPCGNPCTVVIKTVLPNGSTYAQASAYGNVTLSHAYVYSESKCEWYFAHIGQSGTLQCSYTF